MVCPECNGTGETVYFVEVDRDENSVTCEKKKGICRTCKGSGEKPMTNVDRIRAMSDGELAEFILAHTMCPVESLEDCACYETCKQCWGEWLQQPVEDV